MKQRPSAILGALAPALILFGLLTPVSAGKSKATSFGVTGIMGDVHPSWPKKPEAIIVRKAVTGSTADGRFQEGDIIVGVGNRKFDRDPRPGLAAGINAAESQASGGKMTLLLEGGKQVVIKPSVMESYSQTAPYDCLKTEKIIRDTVEGILSKDEIGASATRADLLGLMATGEKKHIERVELLAELCIKDGLDALLGTVHSSSGKWGFKKKMLYAALPLYGGREALLPEFEEHKNLPGRGRDLKKWEALIQAAEEDKDPAKLISAGKAE